MFLTPRSSAPTPTTLSSAISGLFARSGMLTVKRGMTMQKYLYGSGALLLALQSTSALAQTAPAADDAPAKKVDSVIVTGTRVGGLKAIDSASPIQVLDSTMLERTGQPDLIQAIAQNMPSFTAQAVGGDTANLTLSARLRSLSPNDTLVLVNGKRRHTTANLAVLGGPYQGGAATDLNFIPLSAIDHIEVLQDGAAAQYGSDAIAGVINIILKKDSSGGSFSTSFGHYYDGGGQTPDVSANIGLAPSETSFLNLTAESKFHGHSNRGAIDPRVTDPGNLASMPSLTQFPGYPNVNLISGDADYHLNTFMANGGIDLGGGTEIYSNASYGKKTAGAFENYRTPNRIPSVYPNGFNPEETMDETDFSFTGGVKGRLPGDWYWDLSTAYGRDKDDIGVHHSANIDLFNDTGATPTSFHAGNFIASQWTTNLDINHAFDVGMKSPLNFAAGVEYRRDTYEIDAGDPASRYKSGSQSYPGFLLTDAGDHSRHDKSIYVDFALSPIDKLKLDLAARYEDFSDFGSARVGKLTGRYDFTPQFAIRSTISNGFRAPTMAEQYYSATNVGPTTAFVQLAPNSAGAKLVGVDGLKPEKSQNYSLGIVLHPNAKTTITADAYSINIHNRIVGSGQLFGSGGANNSAAVIAAIKANGNILDPSVTQTGINIFSNAVNTRNTGGEVVYTYSDNYSGWGHVDWSATGNYNKTSVRKINTAPSQLLPQALLDATAISDLETASPKYRVNLGALWRQGKWSVNLRESIYGPSSEQVTYDGGTYYESHIKATALTDLDVSYRITKAWTATVGANNLFNQYPDKVAPGLVAQQRANLDNGAVTQYPSFSPFGINGGYYYARVNYTW
jgi:iron complex outermembrane receptor protein